MNCHAPKPTVGIANLASLRAWPEQLGHANGNGWLNMARNGTGHDIPQISNNDFSVLTVSFSWESAQDDKSETVQHISKILCNTRR